MSETLPPNRYLSQAEINKYGFTERLMADTADINNFQANLLAYFGPNLIKPLPEAPDLVFLGNYESARVIIDNSISHGLGRAAVMATIWEKMPKDLCQTQYGTVSRIEVKTFINSYQGHILLHIDPKERFISQRAELTDVIDEIYDAKQQWRQFNPTLRIARLLNTAFSTEIESYLANPKLIHFSRLLPKKHKSK